MRVSDQSHLKRTSRTKTVLPVLATLFALMISTIVTSPVRAVAVDTWPQFEDGSGHRLANATGFVQVDPGFEQVIPEWFKYGIVAFDRAQLHNHSGYARDSFLVDGAIFSNGDLSIGYALRVVDRVVATGTVHISRYANVDRDVFANVVQNYGTINGPVKLLAAVKDVPRDAQNWDLTDNLGNKHRWHNDSREPGAYDGPGEIAEEPTEYSIQDGERFADSIFEPDGTPLENPDLNVVHYVAPPVLDYVAMKIEAERNENTYFTSQAQAISYLIAHKVSETVDGEEITTIRVGSMESPEFLYIDDDFDLELAREGDDDVIEGVINADAFHLEGGIYVSGTFDFRPSDAPTGADIADHYALRINALPYCYPALITYPQPCGIGCRFDRYWQPRDTPMITGNYSTARFRGGNPAGPKSALLNGVIYASGEIHMHATHDEAQAIDVNGALLAFKIHVCDYFQLRHEKAIACTRFLTPRAESARGAR